MLRQVLVDVSKLLLILAFSYPLVTIAQQYAGDVISNSMPDVPGAELAYFRIPDPTGKNNRLTILNYYTLDSTGKRHVPGKVRRVVINVPGRKRNPGAYIGWMSLAQVKNGDINKDSVAIMSILTPNEKDIFKAYPWYSQGPTSNALVWSNDDWSEGANNIYPTDSTNTSVLFVIDSIVQYFNNASLFPALKEIVVAGHSMGGQLLMRYAALAPVLQMHIPIVHWIGNPNSYAWFTTQRPLSTAQCPIYDNWREGFSNFVPVMTYGRDLVSRGRAAVLANLRSKKVVWAHGLSDHGDASEDCRPFPQGIDRNERFSAFLTAFPPLCNRPEICHMVDYINVNHKDIGMLMSPASKARLFTDNFHGHGHREYDYWYPRQQPGDDPYPNPALINTSLVMNKGIFAGRMAYQGCFANQSPGVLTELIYNNASNSVTLCTNACHRASYKIAAMQSSTQCYCGTSMDRKVTVPVIYSSCYMKCPGNSSQTCGGPDRLAVYSSSPPFVIRSLYST